MSNSFLFTLQRISPNTLEAGCVFILPWSILERVYFTQSVHADVGCVFHIVIHNSHDSHFTCACCIKHFWSGFLKFARPSEQIKEIPHYPVYSSIEKSVHLFAIYAYICIYMYVYVCALRMTLLSKKYPKKFSKEMKHFWRNFCYTKHEKIKKMYSVML